jgi:hypothetical protein
MPLNSFVRAIEVWRPDGDLLQRDSGAYGQLVEFENASVQLVLRKGQGLPGAAWQTMRPEVWHDLGPRFVRSESARVAGIGAAVAIPFFHGSELIAVVAFYCGGQDSEGCIEVWDSNGKGELEHGDGYYGRLNAFELVSRQCTFPRGVGLPGQVFLTGIPQIIDDLRQSSSFLRAAAARQSGVESGLGIPIYCAGQIAEVILFLSATSTPLARAFEVWIPSDDDRLRRGQAFYMPELTDFSEARRERTFGLGEDLIGRVYESGVPFTVSTSTHAYQQLDAARAAGIELVLALPIDDGHNVLAVVLLFC